MKCNTSADTFGQKILGNFVTVGLTIQAYELNTMGSTLECGTDTNYAIKYENENYMG